jgi:signal transduction histidine kinase
VLSVLSERGKRFSKKDIAILKLFSPLAMMALRKALLYNELHKALNERDLFISIASHELKNPLTSIYAYSQIIANKIKKGEMPEMDKVDRLLLEELRLNKIMSDFLEVNRIKTGKISFEMKKINLLEVLESAMESFRNIDKEEHRLRSRFERQKAVVWGDPDKIHQAILNVITNSGKYSEKNSLITVSLEQEEDYFRIEIKDRGSGIPEKDLPYVFDRFYRADNTKNQGMGIGLYLVKYIILKHGGKLEIKSRVNKGTTVSILLPILNEKRTGELQTKQNGGS